MQRLGTSLNKANAPYYDDYAHAKEQQYTQLLAVPGRVAQAREITQLQSTMKDIIKSVGDSLMKNGNIIEGCQVIVNSTKTNVTVTSGKIYMNGMVLPVASSEIAITGTGTEVIGAKLVERVVTEIEDVALKDPAENYDNYHQAGCHRIQSEIIIVRDDPEAAILSTLIDGAIYIENYAPEYDTLTQTLARRTYDESGSYIVDGMKVRTEASTVSGKYNIVIEAGKSYVLGYELKIPSARRLLANKSIMYSAVSSSRTYVTGTNTYVLYNDHPFIRNIINVVGAKEVTEQLSNSSSGNILSNSHVILEAAYITVSQTSGGNTTVYTYGTDYTVDQQGSYLVSWNPDGSHPATGESYDITYRYNKEFAETIDYNLEITDAGHAITWSSGDHPEPNTVFTVNYNQYLARKDVVYLDRYGTISIAEGVPAEFGRDLVPEAPLDTLTLAIIHNPPNGSIVGTNDSEAIYVSNVGLVRFTMRDIQTLLNRMKTIEYDQAVLALNDEARNSDVLNKKGIFTDPLIDLSRIDFYFNKNSITFDMALDLMTNSAYLPIDTHTNELNYSTSSTTKKYGRLVTLKSSSTNVVVSQLNATKMFLVNPYTVFPQLPVVTIDPAVDNLDREIIERVPVSLKDSLVISTSTRNLDNRNFALLNNSNYTTTTDISYLEEETGETIELSHSHLETISERAVTHIPQRTITIEGHDFYPNLNNISCYFDGVRVDLTPVGTSNNDAETLAGNIKADSEGYLKATFTIPANILTGTREVILKSDDPVADGYSNEGFTFYTATGMIKNIKNTITTITTVLLDRVTVTTQSTTYVDPIGQTFVLDRMTMLRGIDLYFGSAPAAGVNIPVSCEIRGVINGTITSQVFAHKSLDQVNISTTAAIPTRFEFSDPVLIEKNKEYAFVVRSMSDAYALWVAELGGTEISTVDTPTPKLVLKNPYMTGVMLSSSNNSTWTTHQTTDIKFQLIEDVYNNNAVAQFDDITASEFSRIYLAADAAVPVGTSISWSYKLNGVDNYRSITPYNMTTLNSLKTTISLKAEMSRESGINLSPMLALDTIALTTSCYDNTGNSGYYITKNIEGLSAYTTIKVILDAYEPTASTSIDVKVSINDGDTLLDTVKDAGNSLRNGWVEYSYEATVASSTQCRIFVKASSTHKYETPEFRRLRVIFS